MFVYFVCVFILLFFNCLFFLFCKKGYVCLKFCLFVRKFVCVFESLSVCFWFESLSVCLKVCMFFEILSVCLKVCLFVCLCVFWFESLYVCLKVCLCV